MSENQTCPCSEGKTEADCEACQDLAPGTLAYWRRLEAEQNRVVPETITKEKSK